MKFNNNFMQSCVYVGKCDESKVNSGGTILYNNHIIIIIIIIFTY